MAPGPLTIIKGTYSTLLLIFSIILIMGLIAERNTKISADVHPAMAYFTIWAAILWLMMVEGGQGSLVGLTPVNPEIYRESHKTAFRCTSLAHKGDNLDRYLLGRQFMVVLVVFTVNMSGGPSGDITLWGLPDWLKSIMFGGGAAMILFTCMVGQLNSQVIASLCMLDYTNTYSALLTLWVAMFIEWTGLLHSSYVISMIVSALAGKPVESKEPPRDVASTLTFFTKCVISCAMLGFCFAVTLVALFDGKTTMWEGVPPTVAVIIFFILMSVVGMLEGMQIAFFAVAKVPDSERGEAKFAKMTCDILFGGTGNNLPGFMIGRQLCVVSCMFFIARVTSVSIPEGESNIFGVSDGLQEFFNTGLLGAVITTIVGSITWQLVAAAFPLAFLGNPITYILLRICLLLEASGICSGAWVIAAVLKKIIGYQRDEIYIGTADERAKMDMADADDMVFVGPGHPVKLPGFGESAPQALKDLMKEDVESSQFVASIFGEAQK
eukprot:CAMPEP_0197233736 /NCGR_PEP_ID=MMETSP1429-20130617/1719_1 /TAXON_ID=49237 /ORGANISM="Chaetoceros  sp., Strain UNC1202" /LENGTH=494 /DNA_ID=CAMNT_0042692041 /DNA_START=67 /DNA_END=1551 /DNA_ORIENTATION=+